MRFLSPLVSGILSVPGKTPLAGCPVFIKGVEPTVLCLVTQARPVQEFSSCPQNGMKFWSQNRASHAQKFSVGSQSCPRGSPYS